MSKKKTLLAVGIIFIAILGRLLPHPPNVTPLAAASLFGAAFLGRKWLMALIPIAALWFSDLILNNVVYAAYYDSFVFAGQDFFWTAGAMILVVILAQYILRKITFGSVVASSLMASAIFFLVSNFGVWMGSTVAFPKTMSGLIACYTAGLPFFLNSIVGDLVFCGILFGTWALVERRTTILASN